MFSSCFTVKKTRHYLVGQAISCLSRVYLLRILMTQQDSLNLRLIKWALLLSQYDMKFVPQKATKGQAIAYFLADHPILKNSKLYEAIPDKTFESNITSRDGIWQIFFNGAAKMGQRGKIIIGVGIVFISPDSEVLSYAYSLTEHSRTT